MQRTVAGETAPKRHAESDEPSAEILEHHRGRRAAQPFAHRP